MEVQRIFAGAEAVGDHTVFNVEGNAYRLIVKIEYRLQIIFIACAFTHAEYERGGWK